MVDIARKSKFVRNTGTFEQKCLPLISHIDNSAKAKPRRTSHSYPNGPSSKNGDALAPRTIQGTSANSMRLRCSMDRPRQTARSGDAGAWGVARAAWALVVLATCAHAQFPFGSTMEGSEQLEAYIGVQCEASHEPCRHVVDVRSLYKHTHPNFPDERLALGPHSYISLSIAAQDANGSYTVLLHQVDLCSPSPCSHVLPGAPGLLSSCFFPQAPVFTVHSGPGGRDESRDTLSDL